MVKQRKRESEIIMALKKIINTSLYLLMILGITWFILTFLAQKTIVNGTSMENTLYNGDHLIVDKISYRFKNPERFDIIVFPVEQSKRTYYIKRVIGLPGETVTIDEKGIIYINNEELEESYGKEVIYSAGIANSEITLAADEYFVLGDNRNDSSDSRDEKVGNIKKSNILGKAWIRIWPFKSFGIMKHQ